MPVSKSQQKATAKYNAKAYDRMELKVKKGQGDIIKKFAGSCGESLNAFLNRAVSQAMNLTHTDDNIKISTSYLSELEPQLKSHLEKTNETEIEFLKRAIQSRMELDERNFSMGINPVTQQIIEIKKKREL